MYESDDIVAYLFATYGGREPGVLLRGPRRWYYFLRSLALAGKDPARLWAVVDF